jgi:thiamine kinase-like enzyme
VKTFLQATRINESKEANEAIKNLKRLHRLEMEIQDIQTNVIELYDKAKRHEEGSKERNAIEKRIKKFMEDKIEITKEMEYERRVLLNSLNSIDTKGDLDEFFD